MAVGETLIPWEQEKYIDLVEDWIGRELGRAGLTVKGEFERIKETDMSLVLRVPTNEGDYYFKDGGSIVKHEALLSRHLHVTYPGKTAEVLVAHETEGWLLMGDLQGKPLRTVKDRKIWQKAIGQFAELQMAELDNVTRLLEMGVPDRRMSALKVEIQEHLEEMCATGLNKEDTTKVMTLLPNLLEMCDELESIIPASLEHGDLHSNNIRLVENDFVFFDWGDASVSHPFFSARVFWNALYDLIESESELEWFALVNEFRPYYLEPWTNLAPMKDLERAMRISDELACVQRALSWHLYITPNRKNKQESYNKPSQWLQVLLKQRALHEV